MIGCATECNEGFRGKETAVITVSEINNENKGKRVSRVLDYSTQMEIWRRWLLRAGLKNLRPVVRLPVSPL